MTTYICTFCGHTLSVVDPDASLWCSHRNIDPRQKPYRMQRKEAARDPRSSAAEEAQAI